MYRSILFSLMLVAVGSFILTTTTKSHRGNSLKLHACRRDAILQVASLASCVAILPVQAVVGAVGPQPTSYRSPNMCLQSIKETLTISSSRFTLLTKSKNYPQIKETLAQPPFSTLRKDILTVINDEIDAKRFEDLNQRCDRVKASLEQFDKLINGGLRNSPPEQIQLEDSIATFITELRGFIEVVEKSKNNSVVESVFSGSYTDPINHPGGIRMISVDSDGVVSVDGGGGRGEPLNFSLPGRVVGGKLYVDFRPKGGPTGPNGGFEGDFDLAKGGIRWTGGGEQELNFWPKIYQ